MAKEKIVPNLRKHAVPMKSIAPDPANARRHSDANLDAIRGSLLAFGQQKPIVVDARGVVVAGNGLYLAARQLGWRNIAAIRTTLRGVDRMAYALADNRTAELAEWDDEALLRQLEELRDQVDLPALGFDEEELARLLNPDLEQGLTDPDDVPEPPDEATTRPGDLWLLGNHRLLCGDAGNTEDVDRLLDGAGIHLVNTDPPYNVSLAPRSNNAIAAGKTYSAGMDAHQQAFDVARLGKPKRTHKKMRPRDRPLINDHISDEEFAKKLRLWFGNIARALKPGRAFYIWGGFKNCGDYPPALKDADLHFSQAIIWTKGWPVLNPGKDFMLNHEWCFYGWKKGAAHQFLGPNNVPDVWSVKKVTPVKMIHLTEKPVELAVRAVQYSSKRGQKVLDLFGGSGSTLIACEQTGRRAYLMELDALYCDVIVQRYEQFTGKKAKRVKGPKGKAAAAGMPSGKPAATGT